VSAEFGVAPEETALLFFDALNIYLHPREAQAQAALEQSQLVRTLEKLNAACRAFGIPIFYVRADHRPDGKDFVPLTVDLGYDGRPGEGPRRTTPSHAASGTWEATIIEEIAPQPADYVISKHRWSAFFQTHLELSLRAANIRTIVLAGLATEIGVASTAYSARDRDFNLIVLKDACLSHIPGVNDVFMTNVFPIFARVMTVDALTELLAAA
jgi:nicotinamidase-related amidase